MLAARAHAQQDIVSYFGFTLAKPHEEDPEKPTRADEGAWTESQQNHLWDQITASCLASLALLVQGLILWCVYNNVVVENAEWQSAIVSPYEPYPLKLFNLSQLEDLDLQPHESDCRTPDSICSQKGSTYSCTPSLALLRHWDQLDLNRDGVWSRSEAVTVRGSLKCAYQADSLEFFDSMLKFVSMRERHIWIHPDIKNGTAIPKAYLNYISGDIVMCGYASSDMCGNLIHRGFLDAPLKYGTAPRVGTSIDSAMAYCEELLAPNGICEQLLPQSYERWKLQVI